MKSASIAVLTAGIACVTRAMAADFSLIILPDTQNAAAAYPQVFAAQTAWIKSNAVARAIRAVGHVGDVVNSNVPSEWATALSAMQPLNGVVPYLMTTGNHDYSGSYSGGSLFYSPAYFGPGSAYALQPEITFRDTNRTDAAFITFDAGERQWLMLAVPWQAPGPVMDWANTVVTNHPLHTVLVVVHDYLLADGDTLSDEGVGSWESLVRRHPNILMVFCGHATTTQGGLLTSEGAYGNKVYQMLSNYQQLPNGGNGWLRIINISSTGTVDVSTYSPYLDQWNRTSEHQFSFTIPTGSEPPAAKAEISGMSLIPSGRTTLIALTWRSVTNTLYSVHRGTAVTDAAWAVLAGDLPATPPLNTYTASMASPARGFYFIGSRNPVP